jgi:hypothetical protein
MHEYTSMEQAVGEEPVGSPVFFAGVDYNGDDPDEVEVVRLASERHQYEQVRGIAETLRNHYAQELEAIARIAAQQAPGVRVALVLEGGKVTLQAGAITGTVLSSVDNEE